MGRYRLAQLTDGRFAWMSLDLMIQNRDPANAALFEPSEERLALREA